MHSKFSMRLYRLLSIVISSMALAGCLGEGSGQQRILATPPTPLTGVLIDAPVSGADYSTSGDLSGLTNDQGEFDYFSSDFVTFSVGGIVLGTAAGAPFITVVELTNSVDPTSRAATNMLVFLQSIDSDGDPSNGITISSATRSAAAGLTLDFTAANFSTQAATIIAAIAPGNAVVSESDALFNFYQTYAALGGIDTFSWLFPGFPPVGGGVAYELVFADEFNEGTTPNPGNWTIETGYGPGDSGWGNNEWQLYTESPDNVRVEDGNLVLSALCPVAPCGVRDGSITSGKINTLGKFNFKFGKIVARIKPPVGKAAWPAFWSLGTNFPDIGWPRSGEIDFMEVHNFFSDENTTHFTMHWWDEVDGWVFDSQFLTTGESLGDDFHIFEADWNEDRIIGKIDGVEYFRRAINPATMEEFLEEFYLILNVAMGGTLGSNGQPPSGDETFPQTMLVDYVRVYQQVGGGQTGDVLVDFEGAPESYDFGMDAGFGGGATVVIDNPDRNALNPTAQVAQMQKFPAEVFGGSTLSLGSNLNFSQGTVFKMKVWASRPVEVLFKLEDAITGEPADGKESFVDHSGSSMWEELCFEFDGLGGFTSNSITFIFDLGVLGDATNNPDFWTFYFDEIEQVESCEGGEPPPPPLISSFSNGSFETGDLSDWASDGNNTVGAPGVGAYAGTLAAQLTTTGGTGVAQVTQTFSANPGDEVNFSAWMLTEAALPTGDTFGLAKIVFQDAGGNDLVPESASIGILNTDNPGIDSAPLLNSSSPVNTWVFTEAQGIAPAGTTQVVVLLLNVDFAGGENVMWFDFAEASLVTGDGGGGDAPTVAAPTPTQDSGGVISLFSDAYTDVTVDTWKADFSQASFADVDIAGNATKEYTNLGFAVVETVASQPDLAGATHFHVDVWTPNGEAVLVKLVDFGPDAVFGFGDDTEGELEFNATSTPALAQGEWISLDIPLADFEAEGLVNRSNFAQLIFSGIPFGDVTLYVDNVYFYNDAGEPPSPPEMNALGNAGFEDAFTDWAVGAGDNTVGAPGVGANSGTSAARLNNTADGVAEISQTFAANAGDDVSLSVYMLTEAALPAGATFGLGKIVFQDAGGNDLVPASASKGVINTDNPGIESLPFLNDASAVNTWILSEAQGIAPAGTTQVRFILLNVDFGNGAQHPMWFDDALAAINAGDGGVGEACSPCTIDFETPGFGGGFDWSVFENADNPPLEIVANPDMTGNTSATVAKFTARVDGEFFAGAQTFHPGINNDPGVSDIGPFTFDSTNSVVKVWVWKPVISEVRMQFVNTTDGAQEPLSETNTLVNQWEELTFDFTSFIGTTGFVDTDRLVIFPDWNQAGRTSENIIYFDNFTFGTNEPPPPVENTFVDGGFESGGLSDWGVNGDATVGAPGVGARTGTSAARLNVTGDGVTDISQTIPATPGDEVNLSAWMLSEAALPAAGATFGLAKIVFKDAGGNDLLPTEVSIGVINTDNPGIESTPFLNSDSAVNTWIFTEAQGIAPAGTTQVQFILLNVDFGNGGSHPMWFDDAQASAATGEPPPPPVENTFVDGGFESGGLSDWGVNGDATVGAPGVGARTGTSAARLNVTGDGVTDISQTIPATPGDEVNLSAWMLSEAALPAAGATFGLAKIVFKDAGGNDLLPTEVSIGVINTDNPGIESTPFLNSDSAVNTWIFTEAQGIAPAGTTQVQFILLNVDFGNGGSHPMWFDDAQASAATGEPPPPPVENTFVDGGFESGGLSDWGVNGDATVGAPGVGARTGTSAARLNVTGDGVTDISQTIPATPGDEVNLSAWMLSEAALPAAGATFGLAKIVFQDAGGNDLLPTEVSIGVINTDNPGIESTPFLNSDSAVNTWIFTEAQGIAPAGTTQVKLLLLNVDFGNGGSHPMWFDDAQASAATGEPPPPPVENTFVDGGFESGGLSDWGVNGDATVGAPGVGARTGTSAARLNVTGDGVTDISQTIPATPGDEVNLSAWMLSEAALPAAGATFGLAKIVFKDAGGNDLLPTEVSIGVINTDNPGIESTPFLNSDSAVNTWIFTEAQGIAPAGTTQVQFILLNVDFGNGGSHPMWFDDAQASAATGEPPPPPVENTFVDGGFESGGLGDWAGTGDNSVGAPGVGARTGTSAARLNNTADGVAEISQTFFANPGDEINLSAWMLTEAALPAAGATFGLAKIVFQDAGGNDLLPTEASIGVINTANPGIESTPFLNSDSAVNTWIFTEAQGIAPAGTTQVKLLLLNVDFGNGAQHPMWFDDAQTSVATGEPPPPPPVENAFVDGGFESGDLSDWGVNGDATVGAPSVAGARTDDFAARLNVTGDGVTDISQTFPATPGDEVKLSAWMLTEAALPAAGATFGLAKVVFQDATDPDNVVDLLPTEASIGVINSDNPGIESTPFLNSDSAVDTWVFTEAQGIAPLGTTQVKLLLLDVDFGNGGSHPMWFDDAQASIAAADACGGSGSELTTNGDFELGNLDCWDIFPGGGTITADNTENNTLDGTWSAHAVAGPGNNPVLKQSFLAAGTVMPGDTINISFDMKGSAVAGGIVFPELIDEKSDMGAVGQLLDTIASPTPGWTTYNYNPMAGPDVGGGVTFQIAVVCGADAACSNDVFIDNVTVMINGGGG